MVYSLDTNWNTLCIKPPFPRLPGGLTYIGGKNWDI